MYQKELNQSSSCATSQITVHTMGLSQIASSIEQKQMIRIDKWQGPMMTTIYKFKLKYFSRYNYEFGIELASILSQAQEWNCKVQIEKMEELQIKDLKYYEQNEYQIIYRIDKYDPQLIQNNENRQQKSKIQSEPLIDLLKRHFSFQQKQPFQLLKEFTKTRNCASWNQNNLPNRHSKIDNQQNKVYFYIERQNQSQLQMLQVYQINSLVDGFLKNYNINISKQHLLKKFKEVIEKMMNKYRTYYREQFYNVGQAKT